MTKLWPKKIVMHQTQPGDQGSCLIELDPPGNLTRSSAWKRPSSVLSFPCLKCILVIRVLVE